MAEPTAFWQVSSTHQASPGQTSLKHSTTLQLSFAPRPEKTGVDMASPYFLPKASLCFRFPKCTRVDDSTDNKFGQRALNQVTQMCLHSTQWMCECTSKSWWSPNPFQSWKLFFHRTSFYPGVPQSTLREILDYLKYCKIQNLSTTVMNA